MWAMALALLSWPQHAGGIATTTSGVTGSGGTGGGRAAEGGIVAFNSHATNLVAGDTNRDNVLTDIFLVSCGSAPARP
jgi:hypothetical protein